MAKLGFCLRFAGDPAWDAFELIPELELQPGSYMNKNLWI